MFRTIISRQLYLTTGDTYQVSRIITQSMVNQFVQFIGDSNPIHSRESKENILNKSTNESPDLRVPGALLNSLVSGMIGSHFPGAGTLVVGKSTHFPTNVKSIRKCIFVCI